jgi:hypothetical protein
MPIYSFENQITKEIEDIFYKMSEAPSIGSIININGEKFKRIALKPNASIDSVEGCPFDKKSFLKATSKNGDTMGHMIDLSKEYSERRKDKDGIDPIAEKYNAKRERDTGLANMGKKKDEAVKKLKKLGVSFKEKKESR